MWSYLGQCLEDSHDHLVVHTKQVLTHEHLKLLMDTYQDLHDGQRRVEGEKGEERGRIGWKGKRGDREGIERKGWRGDREDRVWRGEGG